MKKIIVIVLLLALAFILFKYCATDVEPNFYGDNVQQVPAIGPIPDRISLDQNWDKKTADEFWFTSQGAQIIPYSWFVWLEQANNTEYFRSAEHMESLRYLPTESSEINPGGLPIGFTLSRDVDNTGHWLGMTCAACHTNQLDFEGNKFLIEGAPTLGNFPLFFSNLVNALSATNSDDAKFGRFAKKVLANKYSASAADSLRNYLAQVATATTERQVVNSLPADYPKDFTSFARLDAFGEIQNAGSAFALHDLANKNPPTAPVSYPFLWGTHQSNVVQWNASAENYPVVGPLVRNVGEVVGVFGKLSIDKVRRGTGLLGSDRAYSSTVNLHNLGDLEKFVKELQSPAWPEQYLPPIDTEKAGRGAVLYDQECSCCHQVIAREDEFLKYDAVKTPLSVVGTDPAMALNAARHPAKTLILEGTKAAIIAGDTFPSIVPAIGIPVNGVIGLILKDPIKALEAGLIPYEASERSSNKALEDYLGGFLQQKSITASNKDYHCTPVDTLNPLSKLVYKARPLNGIWATAPYLHNGSVPNLWELLQPEDARDTTFWVGSREFDAEHVGFITGQGLNQFKVHNKDGKIQLGNSNRGHTWGSHWTEEQKWDVVEYMKTL